MVGQAPSYILGEKMRPLAEPRIGAGRRRAMRCCMVVMALAASVAGGVSAQAPSAGRPALGREPPSIRVTPENVRFNNYLHDLAGPRALVGVVGGGVLQQLRQHDGNELSNGSPQRATQHAAEMSVRDGLAALMHRSTDYHYQFCECQGFGPRVQHALLETFTDRRADGSRALSVPRIAGTYAGELRRPRLGARSQRGRRRGWRHPVPGLLRTLQHRPRADRRGPSPESLAYRIAAKRRHTISAAARRVA